MKSPSLFWEFYSPQQKNPSVLFGTMHIGHPSVNLHWPRVQDCISNFDHIFTESSLDVSESTYIQQLSLLKEGESMTDYLTQNRWEKMRGTFQHFLGINIDLYKNIHPLFLLTHIQLALISNYHTVPIDQRIFDLSQQLGKPCNGIETIVEQGETLLRLNKNHLYQNIISVSKNISKAKRQLGRLLDLYEAEDIYKLYKISNRSLGPDRNLLLRSRNILMGQRIFDSHNKKPAFFTFGAGHLGGGHGIIRLLKAYGVKIKPLYRK